MTTPNRQPNYTHVKGPDTYEAPGLSGKRSREAMNHNLTSGRLASKRRATVGLRFLGQIPLRKRLFQTAGINMKNLEPGT